MRPPPLKTLNLIPPFAIKVILTSIRDYNMHIFAGGEGGSLFNPPQVVSYWRGLYLFMLSVSEHKAWHTGIAHLKFME